ncbi:MAG: hypothetical protein R3E87_17470 [Burkholderiaceae bacterium]
MSRVLMLLIWLLAASAAHGGLTPHQLSAVGITPPSAARLDLGLNKPALLLFADFNCGTLCNATLAKTALDLSESKLSPVEDYTLVVVGIDPRDTEADARAYLSPRLPPSLQAQVSLLRPDAARLRQMTDALGYRFVFDADNDRFAHPAARLILAADGSLRQVVPALQGGTRELQSALRAAARYQEPALLQTIALYCYGFDPVTGRYSLLIERIMMLAAAITAMAVGTGIAIAVRREHSRARRC